MPPEPPLNAPAAAPPLGAPYRGVAPEMVSLSGLTEVQAREFNKLFLAAFAIFTAIAILAHIAAWSWRPWGHATEPGQLHTPPATATSLLTPASASAPMLKAA